MKKTLAGCTALALAAASSLALADVEKTVEYRQSVYRVIAWNFGPLRAMARGERDFDAEAAQRSATRIAQMSKMLDDAYAERSTAANSDAKELIWEDWDTFQERLTDFQTEAARLAEVAAGGAKGAVTEQFVAMAGTCKACHDRFKD